MKDEMEDRLARDPLMARLERMPFPAMPATLAADALAVAARRPGGRHLRRPAAAIAGLVAVALAATVLAYPPARAAASQLPGLGVLGGLYGATGQKAASLAEATSSGYTLRVTGASDDGTTVVLNLELTPAQRRAPRYEIGWDSLPVVTDSTGRQLQWTFTPKIRSALSTNTLAFRRQDDGSPAGSPLMIRATGINLLGDQFPDRVLTVRGDWAMRLSIRPSHPLQPLSPPAAGRLGTATITFTTARANDAYLYMEFTADGLTPPPGYPGGKGYGADVTVYGPDGRKVQALDWGNVTDSPVKQFWEGQLADKPGTYRIVLSDSGGSTLERTIAVPNARRASVPRA